MIRDQKRYVKKKKISMLKQENCTIPLIFFTAALVQLAAYTIRKMSLSGFSIGIQDIAFVVVFILLFITASVSNVQREQ